MRDMRPIAAALAAKINELAEKNKVNTNMIMRKATEEELIFFYVRMCCKKGE